MADKETPAAKEARTTPYAVPGSKDPSKIYVQISSTSEATRAVLKDELGAKFMGGEVNKWEVDKAKYEGAITKVDAAYAADQAARAAKSADKPAKVEQTEEEKAAAAAKRAEAGQAAAAVRDASRVLVDADTVALGDTVKKDGKDVEVNHIGTTFEKDGAQKAYAYFGDLGAEMEAKAAAKRAEAEDSSPSM